MSLPQECRYCRHEMHVGRCRAHMPYQGSVERGTPCGCPALDAETRQIVADEVASVEAGQWDSDALA